MRVSVQFDQEHSSTDAVHITLVNTSILNKDAKTPIPLDDKDTNFLIIVEISKTAISD